MNDKSSIVTSTAYGVTIALPAAYQQLQSAFRSVHADLEDAGRIRGILVIDAQGNRSQFTFDDIHENVGLDDRLFRFEVPHGVEVIAG